MFTVLFIMLRGFFFSISSVGWALGSSSGKHLMVMFIPSFQRSRQVVKLSYNSKEISKKGQSKICHITKRKERKRNDNKCKKVEDILSLQKKGNSFLCPTPLLCRLPLSGKGKEIVHYFLSVIPFSFFFPLSPSPFHFSFR